MDINTEQKGGTMVVGVEGRLSVGNRRVVQQHVLEALERGTKRFVVDLGATGYIDSAGLGTLVMIAKRVRAQGGDIHLVNLNEDVRTLFELTKLDSIFDLSSGIDPAPAA